MKKSTILVAVISALVGLILGISLHQKPTYSELEVNALYNYYNSSEALLDSIAKYDEDFHDTIEEMEVYMTMKYAEIL